MNPGFRNIFFSLYFREYFTFENELSRDYVSVKIDAGFCPKSEERKLKLKSMNSFLYFGQFRTIYVDVNCILKKHLLNTSFLKEKRKADVYYIWIGT